MSKLSNLINRVDKYLVLCSYLTLFCFGLLDSVRAPYFPDMISDLGISDSLAGYFYAITSFVAFLSGSLLTVYSGKYSNLKMMRLGLFLAGIGFSIFSVVNESFQLFVTCAVFGVGFGITNVTQNLVIIEASTGPYRRQLLSGLHSTYALAALLAPAIASVLYKMNISWRQAYLWFGVFTLFPILVTFLRNSKTTLHRTVTKTKLNLNFGFEFWLICLSTALYCMVEIMISTRLPLYLRRELGFSPDQAALWLAYFFVWMLVGRFYFLIIPVRSRPLRLIQWSLILTLGLICLGLWVDPRFLIFTGLSMSGVFATALEVCAELEQKNKTALIGHLVSIVSLFVVGMHLGIGYLTEAIGLTKAFQWGPVVILLAFFAAMKLDKVMDHQ